MKENTKTLSFVAAAVAVALIAWFSSPDYRDVSQAEQPGGLLFPEFDPLEAASLEVIKYDEATATVRPFKVAQVNNQWSIPSHDNYPADAQNQLADVATGLMGLKILENRSDSPGDHTLYGVVDPDPKTLKSGTTGVGTRVVLRDKNDKALVSLIVGKQVEDREGLHYVRRVGQDPVYTVAVKTDKISTKFEDWIEKDLLKLNSWDIKRVEVNDYSVDVLARTQNPRGKMTVEYNDTGDPKWKMTEDLVFKGGEYEPQGLADDEELDTAKLDAMKTAIDDLKIVDVKPKPAGLSADLKLGESLPKDDEGLQSLTDAGFYPARIGNRYELVSNDGEFRVLMKDGVQYVLRFGGIASAEDTPAGADASKPQASSGMNRYLFVVAEFNESAIEKPQLEPLPEEKPAEKADDSAADEKDAEKDASAEKKDEAASAEADTDKPADQTDDEKAAEEKKPEKTEAELKAERERIEKENKRKEDDYQDKLKKGKERVEELNARFAGWYYVISDDVYKKIHLGRSDIVKKKEAKAATGNDGAGTSPEETTPGTPADAAPTTEAAKPAEETHLPEDFQKLKAGPDKE